MFDLREVKTTWLNRSEEENWDKGEEQVEGPELEEEEILNRCRHAKSEDELSEALDVLVHRVSGGSALSLVARESIVRSLILEIPYRLNRDKMNIIFDGCGILTTISTVMVVMKQLSTTLTLPPSIASGSVKMQSVETPSPDQPSPPWAPLQIPSVLQACLATIYRMLLLVPPSSLASSATSLSFSMPDKEIKALPLIEELRAEDFNPFVQMILLFPQVISNACHRWKVHPPSWAIATKYLPKLVATAFAVARTEKALGQTRHTSKLEQSKPLIIEVDNMQSGNVKGESSRSRGNSCDRYCSTLLKSMLRTRKGEHVARGLKSQYPCGNELVRILLPHFEGDEEGDDDSGSHAIMFDPNFLDTTLSTREFTNLVVSILQLYVSSSEDHSNLDKCQTSGELLSSLELLKAATTEHREAVVQSVALSSKFDPRIGPILVNLLHRAHYLYPTLCEIAQCWSQWTFVHEMEREKMQRHVTDLLLEGLGLLIAEEQGSGKNSHDTVGDELTSSLLQGVTQRLESAFPSIRRDGMMVGQSLAKRLGEELQFEELTGQLGEEKEMNSDLVDCLSQQDPSDSEGVSKRSGQRGNGGTTSSRSDNGEHDDFGDTNSISDDQSVTWDDELSPYDLSDPEEDLVETERPYHLLDALELIRTVESDEHAYANHETGLKYLPELIQSRPDNLPDVAVSLLLSLLKMENKFNIKNFLEMRQQAITYLVIQEPHVAGKTMIEELFEDSGLSDRLNILVALQDAAYDLSGGKSMDCKDTKTRQLESSTPENTETRPKSLDEKTEEQLSRIEAKTRRKRSRPKPPAIVQNRFSSIAPIWFYSLIRKFIDNKEKDLLWRDATGSHFLASFFRALATIVEFSGMHSAQVMGKDLFDLVWSFKDADVAEVRLSVLVAAATSFAMMPLDTVLAQFVDHDIFAISQALKTISQNDPDNGCRTIAQSISQSLNEVSNRSLILN